MENESSRPLWPLGLIAIAAIGLYLYSAIDFESDTADRRKPGSAADLEALANRSDTNILFILVDTLRAERMSAYGYERETTPFLAELASNGVRFEHQIAQSSWTKTSMASLWTSLNPIRSGVTKFDQTLSSDITMPAEILSEAGFKTVGLYRNGWVSTYFGFDQGFEKYYRPAGGGIPQHVRRIRPNAQSAGADESVVAEAVEFLRIHGKSSRWFLYLHLMDLHEYTYDEESALFGNTVSDLYDNSVRRTDWVVSTLYEYMAAAGILDNTIIVLLSDHGEAFGERGFEGHAREVFPETTETPLIISFPFKLEGGVVVQSQTRNTDVWPTLFDLLGLPNQGEIDGQSRKREMIEAARGGETLAQEQGVAVAYLDENWGLPGSDRKPAISVIAEGFRLVSGTDPAGRKFEVLLSLAEGGRENVIEQHPEVAERLRELVKQELETTQAFDADTIELDEMQLDQLRALGYELP